MNRQKILITACVLASISIGTNVWLLMRRKEAPPPAQAAQREKPAAPALPTAAEFDFNGTAFQDGAWKLDEEKGTGKKAPVFEGTGLTDESWKLGGGKENEKDKHPSVGPAKAESPPAPAAPEVKNASGRSIIRRSDFSDTAFEDRSWKLRNSAEEWGAEEEPAIPFDKPFEFDRLEQSCPVTWEVEDTMEGQNYSGPFVYRRPWRFEGTFEREHGDWRDTFEISYSYSRAIRPDMRLRRLSRIGRAIARAGRENVSESAAVPTLRRQAPSPLQRSLFTPPAVSDSAFSCDQLKPEDTGDKWETVTLVDRPSGFEPLILISARAQEVAEYSNTVLK